MKGFFLINILEIVFLLSAFSQERLIYNGQIPVVAYGEGVMTVPQYEEMKYSGITHTISFFPNIEEAIKALDMGHSAGIKFIISCPELRSETEKTVRRLKNHPALYAYFLEDEPNASRFKELGIWEKKIKSIDKNHPSYVNLFPNYASEEQLGTKTYREHVNLFIKEVDPDFLSFDAYPTWSNPVVYNGWYDLLETFRDESEKAGKPFWAFSLATTYISYPNSHPIQTLGMLRLQVYSNLAYGAQGIQYYKYSDTGKGSHMAPILDGKRTIVYDRIKQINEEIKNLSPVFLGSRVISVQHTGTTFIPKGTTRLTDLPDPVKVLVTEGSEAIVSILENGVNTFLVVVNRDFYKNMNLTVYGDDSLKKVMKNGDIVPASRYSNNTEMDPGDCAIYMFPTVK
jgi:hypothetical protein